MYKHTDYSLQFYLRFLEKTQTPAHLQTEKNHPVLPGKPSLCNASGKA